MKMVKLICDMKEVFSKDPFLVHFFTIFLPMDDISYYYSLQSVDVFVVCYADDSNILLSAASINSLISKTEYVNKLIMELRKVRTSSI